LPFIQAQKLAFVTLRLLKKGVFKIITKSEVLKGSYIFNFKFVNKVKNKGIKNEHKKLKLVI
jgi:hypothetical protein